MEDRKLEYKVVDFTNADEAIKVQKEIFPSEDGLINILASLDRDLFIKLTGLDYLDDHVKYYLAYLDNEAIGITGLYYYPGYPEEMWMAWFGTIPKYRHQGYGTLILNWTINKVKESNRKILRLYTDYTENASAINLYEKMGFKGEKYMAEKLSYNCYIYSLALDKNIDSSWNNRNLSLAHQSELEKLDDNTKRQIYNIYKSQYLK